MKKTWIFHALSIWALMAGLPAGAAALNVTALQIPLGDVSVAGHPLHLSVGMGSGLAQARGTPAPVFYSVTDRGPNIACNKSAKIFGSQLCQGRSVIFPVPTFTPRIYKLEIAGEQVKVLQSWPLHAVNQTALTGLPPALTNAEKALNADLQPLASSPDGVDSECIAALDKGGFWIGEEYGPSLLRVNAEGAVLERLVPKGSEQAYAGSAVPIRAVLPPLLVKRTVNRGFEGIALAPDQRTLFVTLQSPFSNPDAETFKYSRNVRILKIALNAQGGFEKMAAAYVFQVPRAEQLAPGAKQKDVKVSALSAVNDHAVLAMVRAGKGLQVYLLNFAHASSLLGTAWAKAETIPSLEVRKDLEQVGIRPARTTLIYDAAVGKVKLPEKVEGMSLVEGRTLVFITDNDFGIRGEQTEMVRVPLDAEAVARLRQSANQA
ncbi:esterase-like activity of phytase family protein [Acidithiobacillus montserratensis]|uniref:Esterase-like activity of phytase family protein n=1 Tax=Acidithiobacillus montserratensis TaxID=2729135 RepID=A0ACD5HHN8_9PROT|nr:esterase-like activity of phytase family protein [Acidithiobacillus montserratensis]MBN2679318.1 esterase-like activity of phytase family protein [Acidithiobacillaceae bacterium]MBU2749063.1 esterase-like activity of phytase family protein [Acidithiobacillus montserratensis]